MKRNFRRLDAHRTGRAIEREWAKLQSLVTEIAAHTEVAGAKFRWRSSGHHLMLGRVAVSFTSPQQLGQADLCGRNPGIRVVFGSLPGGGCCRSSMAPEVWDVIGLSHDARTVVWSVGERGLFRSEELAAEIVREVVRCHRGLST